MKNKKFEFSEFVRFLLYPEDSTDRFPDPFFTTHGFYVFLAPKYFEVLKTLFWIFTATLLAAVISRFCY